MTKNFEGLLSRVNECETKKLAVAVAQDRPVLEAVKLAKERKIADAILVGDEDQIRTIGAEIGMNMDDYKIIDEKDVVEAKFKKRSMIGLASLIVVPLLLLIIMSIIMCFIEIDINTKLV